MANKHIEDDLYKSDIKTILDLWRIHMDDVSYEKVLLFLIDQAKKRLESLIVRKDQDNVK